MNEIIENAKKNYFDLLENVDLTVNNSGLINRGVRKPTLEELPELLGIKVTQFDKTNDLFDGMYRNILVTIYQIYQQEQDDAYGIGQQVEVFDNENNYIRDLTDEEMTL